MPEHNNKSLSSDKRKELLNELTALKASLHDNSGIDMSAIPVLNDIIDIQDDPEDINTYAAASNPVDNTGWRANSESDFDRELFLQEVIDSLMPEIEAELRRRLLALDEQILYRWYHQSHGKV